MDINGLTDFFMWCTILNAGFLVYIALMCVLFPNWIYQVQSKWFSISKEAFNIVVYAFVGLYKLFFIVFVLVPYLALLIIE
ncbi:DUF6868 family protein [Spartinivicinus poritis]|uniref:DUF6868 domain-containing protein n=1 Tax=Spartinivicinus poritis TaxID=2994640 RepID=A0ABT5U708_9GAMM|nr:hypothetical protein [Spartinivicinus sp. A2-2]MDE1462145.1 hypothetical protein [Spartinivicinus sp. A2-2]